MGTLSRRRLLVSAAAAGAAGLGRIAAAADPQISLLAVKRTIEVNGKAAAALALAQKDGTAGIVTVAGRRFRVVLTNALDEPTLVHWHGLTPPAKQDGVPDLSQPALKSGKSYTYGFPLTRAGTNWMHSQVGFQAQRLMAAPLIVLDPAEAELDRQEVVLLLQDFTFRDPDEVFAALAGGIVEVAAAQAWHGAVTAALQLNEIAFDAYLANGRTLGDPEVVRVEPGGLVRLRVINAAASTNFHLSFGALEGELIAVDGHPVAPVAGRRFPIAMAQRLDVLLRVPPGSGAYPVYGVREGDMAQTGIVLATRKAPVARISDRAETASGAIGLELDRRLRPVDGPLGVGERRPLRQLAVALTGSMQPYQWTFDGVPYGDHTPLSVRKGEQVEIVLDNRTDMSHPIHLHGHPFQVVAIDGVWVNGPLRDTVLVPAGSSVTIAFLADNPGHWALRCHNLYHMAAGMMTSVRYV